MATIKSPGEPPFLRPPSRPRTAYPRVAACTAAPCRQGEGNRGLSSCHSKNDNRGFQKNGYFVVGNLSSTWDLHGKSFTWMLFGKSSINWHVLLENHL
jgi:hypothetical protein